MATEQKVIRVWQIGPDSTEYFAANSEEEMRDYYSKMVGSRPEDIEQAAEDLANSFEEVENLDEEFEIDDDGEKRRVTWRKLAEECVELPCQILTGYN